MTETNVAIETQRREAQTWFCSAENFSLPGMYICRQASLIIDNADLQITCSTCDMKETFSSFDWINDLKMLKIATNFPSKSIYHSTN